MQRVNTKQAVLQAWRDHSAVSFSNQTAKQETEFYQRLVVFYYKYLLQKYFSQLKAAKFIVARYAAINSRLKEKRRIGMLAILMDSLKDLMAEKKHENLLGDNIAARVLIFPKLRKCLASKRDIASKMRQAELFRLRKVFDNLKQVIECELAERRAEIYAERHYYMRKLKIGFFVLKNKKAFDMAHENRQTSIADSFHRKANLTLVRKCFSGLATNAWAKFFPYRTVLRSSKQRRILQYMAYFTKAVKGARLMANKQLKELRAATFKAWKSRAKTEGHLREAHQKIADNHEFRTKRQVFSFMQSTMRKNALLATLLHQYDTARDQKLVRATYDDWRLLMAGRTIEKKILPKIIARAVVTRLRQRLFKIRNEETIDQAIRKFRYRWGTRFLIFLLSLNRADRLEKKANRMKSENQWKSVVFEAFVNQARDMKRLRLKQQTIERNYLRLRFRIWRDKALGMLTLHFHDQQLRKRMFQKWRSIIDDNNRLAVTFRYECLRSQQRDCLHALQRYKNLCNDLRYKLLQAITFERCSSKRRVFGLLKAARTIQTETDASNTTAIEHRSLRRFTTAWREATIEHKKLSAAKSQGETSLLQRVFSEWRSVTRDELRKAERERLAGKLFWEDKKKDLVMSLVSKVLEKKAEVTGRLADLEGIKRKKAITLAHSIGKRWLEKVRKRLKDNYSVRMAFNADLPGKSANAPSKSFYLVPTGGKNLKEEKEQEQILQDYLLRFKNKKRLEPSTVGDKPKEKDNPQDNDDKLSKKRAIIELEKLLEDYRVKTSLLKDDSLPFTIKQMLQKDQADLKEKIKDLYSLVNSQ